MQDSTKTLQLLGAFWQHFGIHKRKSDFSNKPIVSVLSEKCPYPVWHKDEWIANSNPPFATYEDKKDFWNQIWELFSRCPMAHNTSLGNENSEYTDDSWYSKDCYLCHSILNCEDCKYSYRILGVKNSYFSVFSFDSDLCVDLIHGYNCYNVKYALDVKRCKNSAFLFDCQDCENCLLCWNLRNKKYCIANKQYTKEEYENEIKKYNLNSRKVYSTLKNQFLGFIKTHAWWKAIHFDNVENSTGDYLDNCKDCENCFSIQNSEDNKNSIRAFKIKKTEYTIGIFDSENIYYSIIAQDKCYDIKFSYNVAKSKYLEYCMSCLECENCFLCAGLVGKKYYILNKEYSEENYEKEKIKIVEDMKNKGVYGEFFPAYFSPTSYDESLSSVYVPLTKEEQKKEGFRITEENYGTKGDYKDTSEIPDNLFDEDMSDLTKIGFWDDEYKRPFQILKDDIEFYKKLGVPVNDKFYIRRIRENFSLMYQSFNLRETICVKSGEKVLTTLPKELDKRIVSLKEYEKLIY